MTNPVNELLISEISVGERVRKDAGDLTSLMKSIAGVGLLQPVVITSDRRLIAGWRRMLACEAIGLQSVLVAVADDVATAQQLLIAERDENTCRLDFTPSEAVAMGKRLEELESPAAKKRRETGKKAERPSSNLDEPVGRTDDRVAEAIGMGKTTYRKAKAVVDAAARPDAADDVKFAASEMDRTGKVDPAYRAVTRCESGPVGLRLGKQAAAMVAKILKRIPPDDIERQAGFDLVSDAVVALL